MTSDGVALVPSVPSPQVRISAPSRIDLHTARRGTHRPSRQATGDARRWLAEHGEQGFRYPGDRTEEILDEQLAKAFRQHVVDLVLEYARFDEERRFYCDRAMAIANGSLPEDKDIPFYASMPARGTSVIGAGPLRISVGNCRASGQDGASTGQLQTELRQRGAFPFASAAPSPASPLEEALESPPRPRRECWGNLATWSKRLVPRHRPRAISGRTAMDRLPWPGSTRSQNNASARFDP